MRIARLDLLRYGKFTGKTISLPAAARDFHLIAGPNEAGKSTLRDAIQDLLFGIEPRSRYNFLHPHSEMCLGARLEAAGGALDFHRVKARSNALRTPVGERLPDSALTPFLGPVDRNFFDQMFGLNHERLINGGKQILNASNDIGRILFQAAAGIGSLGEIRTRLEQEAGKLWARRKSSDREYYQASAELDQARAALEQATVRTKDWQEARQQVATIRARLDQAQDRRNALEQERNRLERVRRVAPLLAELHNHERELAGLGVVIPLPEAAGAQLAAAEQAIALAGQSLRLFEQQSAMLAEQRDDLSAPPALLARACDIEDLAATRQRLSNHERDIGRREEEVRVLWQRLEDAVRQLGWAETDAATLARRLPSRLVRGAIDELLRRHEALVQMLEAAEDAIRVRERELANGAAEIDALPDAPLPETLPGALEAARALGDAAAQQQRLDAQVERLAREYDGIALELGDWAATPAALRALALPAPAEVADLLQRRSRQDALFARRAEQRDDIRADIASLQLDIDQYRATHQPVTLAEVLQQRTARDAVWQAIKSSAQTLSAAASRFEQQSADADALADQRHDKARQATELQARLDRLAQRQQQAASLDEQLHDSQSALAALDQSWDQLITAAGLPGLPLQRCEAWRATRERALQAANALEDARHDRDRFQRSAGAVTAALADALRSLEPAADRLPLPALLKRAEQAVTAASATRNEHKALTAQQSRAAAALAEARYRCETAGKAMADWQVELQQNLAQAQLPADATVGALRGTLGLFDSMSQDLEKIRDLRANRIDLMRRDLEDYADAARALAASLDSALAGQTPDAIALTLASRLSAAKAAAAEHDRLTRELTRAAAEAAAARQAIAAAQAGLAPLLERLPPPASYADLRAAIERSDRQRRLSVQRDQALQRLLRDGDGLDRDRLAAEVAGIDLESLPGQQSDLAGATDQLVSQQNQGYAELSIAEARLHQIAGQADAARAEARRQEALARMGNAVERFIRVHTAARLLRWSIERFRETRQGPLLARASEIFCGLTEGALHKLLVDYDSTPPTLSGQRPGGAIVPIDGMSEGTRDQLYLALRLAALELHLEQTAPLPFIADDLFINYDDTRARAGFAALAALSERTQVIFLSHHQHLAAVAQSVFGTQLNLVRLEESQ